MHLPSRDDLAGLTMLMALAILLACVSAAHCGDLAQRYEQTWAPALPIFGAKLGWFKPVPMTDTEVAQIIALKEAELRLDYEKQLNAARLDKEQDRLSAENRVRWAAYICMGVGFVLIIVGVLCCIYADKMTGIKGIVAGFLIGGMFGFMAAYTQWFLWIIGGGAILGAVALGVWLWLSGRTKVVLEKAVEGGEILKVTDGWAADQPAHDRVRAIQGAKPGQKTLSWIEQRIAETRDAIKARKAKQAQV